jgi:SH3 domain protein
MIMIKKLLILAQLSMISFGVSALETGVGYISDNVSIPMRSKKSFSDESILIRISSGDRVEVIQDDDNRHEEWSKVKFGTTEGWILSRYLMPNVSFKDKFKQLEVENKLLSERVSRLLELNKKGLSESHDNLLTYLRKDNLRLYGEDMKEHRRKDKEFEAKQKEVNLLAERLENRLKELEDKKAGY